MDTTSSNGRNQPPQRHLSRVSLRLRAMVLCASFAFLAASTAASTLPTLSPSGDNPASRHAMQQRGGSRQGRHQRHREWAREEKERMLSRQLLTDLHSLNSDVPNMVAADPRPAAPQSSSHTPSSTASPTAKPQHTPEHPSPTTPNAGKPLIPLEAGPRPVLGMWRSIIRSAQRQRVSVIVYIVSKEGRTLQQSTASVRSLLGEDPGIDVGQVLFVEGYGSDSVWMRDFGPIFFLNPDGGVGLRLAGDVSDGGSSSSSSGGNSSGSSSGGSSSGGSSSGGSSGRTKTAAGEGLGGGGTSAASRRMLGGSGSGPLLLAAGPYALAAGAPVMQPSILDIRYYSDRPADDALPIDFGNRTSLPVFASELLFEGGNLLSDGRGMCIMSDRVLYVSYRGTNLTLVERKAALSEAMKPFGCASLIIVEALNYDITGHVDMWLSFLDPATLLMGMYTRAQNPLDHLLLHHNAALLRSKGLEVITAPMPTHCPGGSDLQMTSSNLGAGQAGSRSIVDGHRPRRPLAPQTCPDLDFTGVDPITRTYLNVLQLNNEVLVPVYDDDNVWEGTALGLWGSVAGGRYAGGVVPVPADDLIAWHGSLHCITRTVPAGTLPVGWVAAQLREQSRRWSHAAL
ncbi:MAG: hypothetical protein WDW36_006885 [Sanguina aurantia]